MIIGAKITWRHQRSRFRTEKNSLEEFHPQLKGEKIVQVFPDKYWDVFSATMGKELLQKRSKREHSVCLPAQKGYKTVLSRHRTAAVPPTLLKDQGSR